MAVLVYFGDSLRANPGEPYLQFFGQAVIERSGALTRIGSDAFNSGFAFDAVIDQAAALGVRIYPVQAEGLTARMDPAVLSTRI